MSTSIKLGDGFTYFNSNALVQQAANVVNQPLPAATTAAAAPDTTTSADANGSWFITLEQQANSQYQQQHDNIQSDTAGLNVTA